MLSYVTELYIFYNLFKHVVPLLLVTTFCWLPKLFQLIKELASAFAIYRHVTTLSSPPPRLTWLLIGCEMGNQHKVKVIYVKIQIKPLLRDFGVCISYSIKSSEVFAVMVRPFLACLILIL